MGTKTTIVDGLARDAKAGAVVVADGGPVYIAGLAAWPAAIEGRRVRARGLLREEKYIPDPVGSGGTIAQGAEGEQRVLREASWELFEAPLHGLIERLGRDDASPPQKQEALDALYRAGIEAFPLLIDHLDDARRFERHRDVQNYMGMAANAKRPEPLYADIPVGEACRDLLHRLITPIYRSPYERVFKPRGELFIVKDWEAWWEKNKGRSLEDIRKGLEPLVDRYFQTGGDPQAVE